MAQLFGPRALARGLQAAFKGHGIGWPVGDPLLMPGAFLMRGDQMLWSHEYRHVGDHPNLADVVAYAH
jgi:hypothetical protein